VQASLEMRDSIVSGNLAHGILNRGTTTLVDSIVSGNSSSVEGGGISSGGTLSLYGTEVFGNSAVNGGGISNGSGLNSAGPLTIVNSTIHDNVATGSGAQGGCGGGLVCVNGSTFPGPSAVTIVGSTFYGNTATTISSTGYGGAIYAYSGLLTVTNSTFSGNSGYFGGAVNCDGSASVLLSNCTIAGNSATYAGGVFYKSGYITLLNTIVAQNVATGVVRTMRREQSTAQAIWSATAAGCRASRTATTVI
jgi:predicted outer membrane repeat protein